MDGINPRAVLAAWFAGRALKMWLIDGGCHGLQSAPYGRVPGLWH